MKDINNYLDDDACLLFTMYLYIGCPTSYKRLQLLLVYACTCMYFVVFIHSDNAVQGYVRSAKIHEFYTKFNIRTYNTHVLGIQGKICKANTRQSTKNLSFFTKRVTL